MGNTSWWQTFFDEGYVDAWAAAGSFASTADDVRGVAELLAVAPGHEVLDVPCGFGRIAGGLHALGFTVTGIDASAPQIRLAEERNPGPRYMRADMRRPPPGPFDAVVNLFSSFGYFDDPADDVAALRAWHGVLRPGGVLVMELMHRDGVAHRYRGDDDVGPATKGPVRETGSTDWVTGVRRSTVTYGDVVKTFTIRLYSATDLVARLRAVGFTSIEAWGDLHRAPLSPATRLALRARRATDEAESSLP